MRILTIWRPPWITHSDQNVNCNSVSIFLRDTKLSVTRLPMNTIDVFVSMVVVKVIEWHFENDVPKLSPFLGYSFLLQNSELWQNDRLEEDEQVLILSVPEILVTEYACACMGAKELFFSFSSKLLVYFWNVPFFGCWSVTRNTDIHLFSNQNSFVFHHSTFQLNRFWLWVSNTMLSQVRYQFARRTTHYTIPPLHPHYFDKMFCTEHRIPPHPTSLHTE